MARAASRERSGDSATSFQTSGRRPSRADAPPARWPPSRAFFRGSGRLGRFSPRRVLPLPPPPPAPTEGKQVSDDRGHSDLALAFTFLAGAILGAGIALLLAPQSG